ncbi:glycosyltransferase [Algoriphagus chordae]|uniref:Glycosyl transferase family 2 n=1 Tax=Algoriphagus chordae TaxID=237019 RepID=A0A2W7QHS9_9BACT|nr:glycosyltransferase [Algoriphagus chordae]PZX47641.1 glycosyl transferase family 2 [Algoriphagus chordae]
MNKGVSIIICCYNSADRLPTVLDYLNKLEVKDFEYEVIVVDNLSTDATQELATSFFFNSNLKGRVVHEPIPGLSNARKKGVFSADFPVILFCDDDNFLNSDYLIQGMNYFLRNEKLGCLGGYGIAKVAMNLPYWFDQFSSSYAVGSLGKSTGIQNKGVIHYGAGLFFKTDALKSFYLKSIDSSITDRKANLLSSGGDSELCLAVQLEGFEIAYDSKLNFYHEIKDERITEAYYLKLREGILSNYPILTAYDFLLSKSEGDYRLYLAKQVPVLLSGVVKTYITLLRQRDFISRVYCYNFIFRFKYLIRNYSSAINLYHQLKRTYS